MGIPHVWFFISTTFKIKNGGDMFLISQMVAGGEVINWNDEIELF